MVRADERQGICFVIVCYGKPKALIVKHREVLFVPIC